VDLYSAYHLKKTSNALRATGANSTEENIAVMARPAWDSDRLLHGAQQHGMRQANAGSATFSA